jgi:hypothetical protein
MILMAVKVVKEIVMPWNQQKGPVPEIFGSSCIAV